MYKEGVMLMESLTLYQQFRRTVEKSAWLMIFLIFIIEAIVAVLMINQQMLVDHQTPLEYSLSYVVLPTMINMECAALYHYIEFKTSFSENIKNYFLIIVFNTFCLSTSLVHNALPLISLSFVLPIFLSAIFGNKRMTDRTFFMSLFSYLFSAAVGIYYTNHINMMVYLNYIAGMILMCGGYLIAKNIIIYQKKNHDALIAYNERQKVMIEELKKDSLTQLYNHNTFYNELNEQIVISRKKQTSLVLAIIDIDNFKRVNDTYGHVNGDYVLISLSNLMKKFKRKNMVLARYGGEEFCILFMDTSIHEAYRIMEKMRLQFSHNEFPQMPSTRITFSVGLVALTSKTDNAVSLVEKADCAMYQAKRDGKNKITVYDETCVNEKKKVKI